MKVQISTAENGVGKIKVIDTENMAEANNWLQESCEYDNVVFRLSEYDEKTHHIKEDGSGNEASWWSFYCGTPAEILEMVQNDRGDFPKHDKVHILPFVKECLEQTRPVCCIYCIPKPKVRHSGRFMGPDKQSWVTAEWICELLRTVFHIPLDMDIFVL